LRNQSGRNRAAAFAYGACVGYDSTKREITAFPAPAAARRGLRQKTPKSRIFGTTAQ
jgi:hypothetical protein